MNKSIMQINKDGLKETLEYNINECEKRGILPEYVKDCKQTLTGVDY